MQKESWMHKLKLFQETKRFIFFLFREEKESKQTQQFVFSKGSNKLYDSWNAPIWDRNKSKMSNQNTFKGAMAV